MKRFFLSLLMISVSVIAMAQSASMLSMARAELDKRGLTEAEVRARLLQDGINPEAIPPTEYPKYQGRVMAILDELQAQKAGAAGTAAAAPAGGDTVVATTDSGATVAVPVAAADAPQTTMGEAAAESALEQTLAQSNVSPTEGNNIYGHSMFTGKTLDVFRTTDGAQAPDTYILGEGDEVHISIFGSSQTEIHQRIAADGSLQPAGSSKIFLKGLTLAQGRAAIRSKLSQHYSFRPDQIAVTISTARTLSVSIYGEVGVQGGFTISALNNVFNALAAAGGPTANGSVRNIQLSRAGKNYSLDLYKYMTNPTVGLPYDLQNNDVLFVPLAQKIVSIEGAVKRPMQYEMVEDETLTDLIELAGGLAYNAYPEFVQIERQENGELSYKEYKLSEIMSGKKVSLRPGDVVRIKSSARPLENYVEISGDVYYGGRFDYESNKSLKALIEKAEPRYTVKKDYVIVERTNPDETVEVITVPFPGEDGNPDFTLQARDRVSVLEQADYRDTENIAVSGQVRRPFTRAFGLNDRMTIGQAIELAGGLKPSVYPVAYITRKDISNPDKKEYLRISLEGDKDKYLQPGDQLTVYDNTTYTNIGEVRIAGAVKNATGVTYDPNLTIHDLIMMAGGFEVGAAYDMVQVFRVNISETAEVDYDVITLAVDEDYNVKDPSFQLQPYDHVVVRMTPNFSTGRTVEVSGRVKYPGVYVLEDSRTQLSHIIELAGGLLDDADPYTSVFRTQGRHRGRIGMNLTDMNRRKGKIDQDPILMDGDVVNVSRQENTVVIRALGTRMNQYVPEDFSDESKTVIYQGGHRAAWYIKNFAGGYQKYADRKSVTVTLPNGQAKGTKQFIFRATPVVEPGSVITLGMDQDKIEDHNRKMEEPKSKVDIESVAAKTLSGVTSVVSIIILSRNLLKTAN